MNWFYTYNLLVFICIGFLFTNNAPIQKNTPRNSSVNPQILKLKQSYSNFIVAYTENTIIINDGTSIIFDDKKVKNTVELFDNPDLEDMFKYKYIAFNTDTPAIDCDPGRIRNEFFFKKMYGATENEVRKNLDSVIWLRQSMPKKIFITKINGVSKQLQKISDELDTLKHLHKYIDNIGGTFYWRKILNTNRLSAHSFGIAIDINVKYSDYWEWDKKKSLTIKYKNRIPSEIVYIFEKYGFIWGGKWYHYDTMHFEYRPELLN